MHKALKGSQRVKCRSFLSRNEYTISKGFTAFKQYRIDHCNFDVIVFIQRYLEDKHVYMANA